jgi:hypothetical protein
MFVMWHKVWVIVLAPNDQSVSYLMASTSCIQWNDNDDDVRFVLDQHD